MLRKVRLRRVTLRIPALHAGACVVFGLMRGVAALSAPNLLHMKPVGAEKIAYLQVNSPSNSKYSHEQFKVKPLSKPLDSSSTFSFIFMPLLIERNIS
jgi:hypothetical protein